MEQEVATRGYGNVSEYFRALLRDALAHELRGRLDRQLLEGLERHADAVEGEFWPQLRAAAMQLLATPRERIPATLTRMREPLDELCRQHQVQELWWVGAPSMGDDSSTRELELAVHLGKRSGAELAAAFARFKQALEALLANQVDLLEVGSMGPTRLRRLLEQQRRVLYPRPR